MVKTHTGFLGQNVDACAVGVVSTWFRAAWKCLSTSVIYRLCSIKLCALISAELWPHPTHTQQPVHKALKRAMFSITMFHSGKHFHYHLPQVKTFNPMRVNFPIIWTKGNPLNGPLRVGLWRINNPTEQKRVIKVIKCALHLQMKLWVLKLPSRRYLRRTRELLQRSLRNKRYKTTASH